MAYMYLGKQIKESGKSIKQIAHFMGITERMLTRKLLENAPFTAQEAANLKHILGSKMSLEELFARKEN